MTQFKNLNEIEHDTQKTNVSAGLLPNAVQPSVSSILLRKKRHMSGLMCPPPSFVLNAKDREDRT